MIFNFLFEYIIRFLRLIGLRKNEYGVKMNGIRIMIKYENTTVPLVVMPNWTVADVIKKLESKLNLKTTSNIRIIFAGKLLDDNLHIRDCDVGQYTVIHAVCKRDASEETSTSLLNASVMKLQLSEDERCDFDTTDVKKVNFFVYCSSPCKNVCPGKLRVRCSSCKEGTLTVSQDPCCWDDVLIPNRIHGVCQAENCNGRTAEFYFKCAIHAQTSQEETAVALDLIKNNFKGVPCLACTSISEVILVFPCEDHHVICLDCFREYCIVRLNERGFLQNPVLGYTLPCPVGCDDSLIKETHHYRLLNEEQYERYQHFGAEECLLQAGGVLCPQPGCGAGILPDEECNRVVCVQQAGQGCGFVFCKHCLQGFHIGPCDELEQSSRDRNITCAATLSSEHTDLARWEEASKRTIKGTTKPCPKCRTPTEKDGGCMHMVCVRSQCSFHWCWVCQTEWTRDCMGAHWFG